MMRFGFATRLLAIVLASLVAFQILAVAVVWLQRSRATDGRLALPLPDQAKALVELLEEMPKEQWPKLLRAANSSDINARIVERREPAPDSAWFEAPVAELVMRRYLSSLGERKVHVRVEPSSDDSSAATKLLHWATPGMIEIEIGLKTGETLLIAAYGYSRVSVLGLPPGMWAGLLGLLIAILAIYQVRKEARPLLRLAEQVDRVNVGPEAVAIEDAPKSAPEIRALVAAFNRYGKRIEALLRARMVLVSGISHDLRTYVTRLRLRADLIPDAFERDRAVADLDDMSRLLDDSLMAFSGGSQFQVDELVEMTPLIEREVDERRTAGGEIVLDVEPSAKEALVLGNTLALKRVIANLTENAISYGRSAHLHSSVAGGEYLLCIDDHGPGLKPEERAAVFEPFVRLETSRNRRTGGAGLGLSIARSIVERHKGHITLEEAPSGGTRALVALPVYVPESVIV